MRTTALLLLATACGPGSITVQDPLLGPGQLTPPSVGMLPLPDDLAQESSACWTLGFRDTQLSLLGVGMDSGYVEAVIDFGQLDVFYTFGLAFDGEDTLVVASDGLWHVLDVPTGTIRVGATTNGSQSIAFSQGRWFGSGRNGLAYDDIPALLRGDGEPHGLDWWEMVQAHGDTFYSTYTPTDRIATRGPDGPGQVLLEAFDGNVSGIGITDAYVQVLNDGAGTQWRQGDGRIHRFDQEGNVENEVFLDRETHGVASGLWCR